MKRFDVVIIGGGMVGLTAALAIRKLSSLTVAVIDNQPLQTLGEAPELRVSAISAASQHILANLDVWGQVSQQRLQPYQSMHVWDKDGYGKLNFDQQLLGSDFDNLGWIIENKVLRNSLYQQAEQTADLTLINATIAQLAQGEQEVFISLEGEQPITSRLVVAADGANSWVRSQLEMPLAFRDYDHHALVATVNCQQGHQNTAWQVFLEDGPLAMLPLYQPNLCSIVWSLPPEQAADILALPEEQVNKRLTAATDGKLGKIQLASEMQSHPLSMRFAREVVKGHVVLIGDAAHTIHPLAGQGVNLGLLDAVALAQTLSELDKLEPGVELQRALAQFGRWRKSEAADMIAAMEAIKQLFTHQQPLLKLVRGIGMSLVDQLSPVKKQLVKQAMGLKSSLPELAKAPKN
jgi:2-octaprenylphenol hydroxylase